MLFTFYFLRVSILSIILFVFACSPTAPIFKDTEITLEVDAEVTETWITLSSVPVEKNAVYYVKRDDQLIFEGKLTGSDTLIHDEKLEIATTYNYSVYASKGGEKSKTVSTVTTTLDTTSHDFIWETYTVSERLDVDLRDVSIVNKDNIWVVGFIPSGEKEDYNAVHWDGVSWNLERIIMKGNVAPEGPHRLNSVYTITQNNIWVSNGSYGHWDGSSWKSAYKELAWWKIWGDINNNVWFIGSNGKISHYNGSSWQAEDSKTTTDLVDIFGFYDERNDFEIVYACGFKFFEPNGVLLRNENGNGWQVLDSGENGMISSLGSGRDFSSLWMANINTFYVTVFNDVYKIKQTNSNKYKIKQILDGYRGIYRLRGNEVNDLFIGGERTQLRHFNGKTWRHYSDVENPNITIYSLDFKNDIIVAVSSGTIFMGRRN